jgi:transposase
MAGKRRRNRLQTSIPKDLIRHFVAGATTCSAAEELCGVNRNTAILYFHKLRELIADMLAVDESDFGGVRKGTWGRGAAGKVPVFGLLKRCGRVYAVIIPNARSETLLPIFGELDQARQHCLHRQLLSL